MKNGSFSRLAVSAAAALLMFSSLSMTGCTGKKSQIKYATVYKEPYKKELEEYVIKNSGDLKKYVIKDLLGY